MNPVLSSFSEVKILLSLVLKKIRIDPLTLFLSQYKWNHTMILKIFSTLDILVSKYIYKAFLGLCFLKVHSRSRVEIISILS